MTDSTSPFVRQYGAKVDAVDHRDLMMAPEPPVTGWFTDFFKSVVNKIAPPTRSNPSDRVDLEAFCGPVKDQGNLGCCTGFAYAGYREYLYRKFYTFEKDKTVAPEKLVLSPLFVYYNERDMEGTINEDNGAQMRSGCVVLKNIGCCLESEDPYKVNNFKTKPDNQDYTDALKYRVGAYHRLRTRLDEVQSCIRSGYPVAAGISVYESFESKQAADTGIIPVPNPSREKLLGGHAILMIGYDKKKKVIKCRNSWSKGWGDNGNFYLPERFICDAFINDMWMAHLGPAWKVSK